MTQALNYTPKAIASLASYPCPRAPLTKLGMDFIAGKLREAQVFVLADHGQLLDREKPRPEVPLSILRPPFPVVALEYEANTNQWPLDEYTASKASKRIALAWQHQPGDHSLPWMTSPPLPAGVLIASVAWYDEQQTWMPVMGAAHVAFDEGWVSPPAATPFKEAAMAAGRLNKRMASAPSLPMTMVPLFPEACFCAVRSRGASGLNDILSADLMDEVNAYFDLCMALACRNVSTREYSAPTGLNRQRIKAGKLPLKGFHVLELFGESLGGGVASADRNAPRSHLRRGHVRRLGGERVTWVNSTIVRGRGFVDKVYAA